MFAVSAAAFTMIKYAGACYLIYMGVRALRRSHAIALPLAALPGRPRQVVRAAFVVSLLNPMTASFFATFLPQFLGSATASLLEMAILGGIFVAIAAVTDTGTPSSLARSRSCWPRHAAFI